ncbi:hypothetical protein LX59_02365 [Azomonas agilis]|uniref:Uncharacterized protein n=1 Tax=Azomonas agilis TaxID=116849 RepID=A0A562I051_9GAMM|nr:hypothetical protein [Azomonas agilis]TWH64417.1 hypothetical protein LX59_02365 [Azomonas agilis]
MQLLVLLILILIAAAGVPALIKLTLPEVSDPVLIGAGIGSLLVVWILMRLIYSSVNRRKSSADSLERRARRLTEEANRRNRAAQRQ